VEVWRPVEARHLGDDQYVISGATPPHETWEFQPGEVVRCRVRTFSDGSIGLVAFARIERGVGR
jgi:hypothetical protein